MNPATIFIPRCTCNRQLGALQHAYELVLKGNGGDTMAAHRTLKVEKMCCRISILNSSNYFILCADQGRIIDEKGHIKRHQDPSIPKIGNTYRENGKVVKLSRMPPSIPILPGGIDVRFQGGGGLQHITAPPKGLDVDEATEEKNFLAALGM